MATKTDTETATVATGEAVLAARYRREMVRSAERTWRRCVKEFARDASCSEAAAKRWLEDAGIAEPKNGA